MEYRRKCNVCGKIFCFTDEDIKDNLKNTAMAGLNALGQIGSVFGGTIFHTSYFSEESNRFKNKVIDYDKCPYCNSSDIEIVVDDELEDSFEALESNTNKLMQNDLGYFKITEQTLLMSEKYELVFETSESVYTANSPVIFLSGALFKHVKTDEIVTQLKFQNISKKIIKAVKIEIVAIDSFGEQINGISDFAYIDLNISTGKQWGENIAIKMPNASVRSVDINLKQIIFNDGSIWNNTENKKIPLNNVVTLQNALESEQLIEQFKIEYGKNAQNLFFEEHDIWHCVCGTINLSCDGECCICRAKKELLATYDFEKLKLKTNERLEKAEATRKDIIYDEAKKLMLMKDITSYEDAIEKFESISGWRDSIELITQCNHCIKEKKKQNNIIRSVIAAIFLLLVIVLSIIGTNMENDMRKTLSGKKIRGVYKYNCEYFYTKDTYTICFEDENYCDIYCKFTTDFDSGEDYCSYEEYKNVPYKITGGVFGLRFMWDKNIGPYRGAQPFEIDLSNGSVEMYTPNFSNDKPMHMSENY